MIICLYIFLIFSFFYTVFYREKKSLHMLQQNLYNENNRYLKWIFKNIGELVSPDILSLLLSIAGFIWFKDDITISSSLIIIMSCILIYTGYTSFKKIINDQNKKKLVVTARIKRLIFTTTLIYLAPLVILGLNISNIEVAWIIIIIESVLVYLNAFVVFIALLINMPVEKMIFYKFMHQAKTKLKRMNNLKIIGITGSYGKTSSKNILADILNVRYNAYPTPRNLNTYNGLMMTINNYMDKFTEIFIAEMGAYVRGEIKGLCKFIKPKYGILTKIGTAHLESFGSQENIQKGKFELIESLPSDGFGVLNGDDPLQINYNLKNKVKIIWIGIDNKDVDVRATNIKCSNKGTEFDVVLKDDKKKYHFQTKLLGKHNVYNILAGIACGIEFDIEMESLIHAVKGVKPVEHRLELKKLGNFYQIDDAYNSNPVGAKNACEILGMMPGLKVVVTPGMIELGDKEDEYNEEFGKQIAEVADKVILIGEKKTKPIKKGLLEKKFNEDDIIVFNDVRDAYPFIGELASKKEVYALFENDLPDTFNEK